MTKKDFITVAEALRGIESSSDRWLTTNLIADSLAAAYPKFDTDKFIQYAAPLVEGRLDLPTKGGLPKFAELTRVPVEKVLAPRPPLVLTVPA